MTAAVVSSRDARAGARKRPSREAAAPKARSEPQVHPGAALPAPSRVSEIQRQRILTAMADVTAEHGAASVTVAHIVARSGVSRRTFYELFSDREECLLAALDQAIAHATTAVLPAYHTAGPWREQIRGALAAMLAFLDEEPAMARLCVVESLGAGPQALERRTHIVHTLIAAIDKGRETTKPGKSPPPLAAEGVVGAVLAVIHARLLLPPPERKPLSSLLPPLMGVIVLPYLGQQAAEKELHKPAPPIKKTKRIRKDPLEGLDMRLTYRTVRVLIAIADHPHASNREIATAAGIADQGQISKLLTRLQNLGLTHNKGHGAPKGAPNAWDLTPKGQDVEQSIRTDTRSHPPG